jgi:hypothetical protein
MIRFENRENGRFYYMVVEQDITNKLILNIIRGGKRVRVITSILFESPFLLKIELDKRSKRRIRNGYSLVT